MTIDEFNNLDIGQIVRYEYIKDDDSFWLIEQITHKVPSSIYRDSYYQTIVLSSNDSEWPVGLADQLEMIHREFLEIIR